LVLFRVFFKTATVCSCELTSSIVFGRYFSTQAIAFEEHVSSDLRLYWLYVGNVKETGTDAV
jgi:hypothetical protein